MAKRYTSKRDRIALFLAQDGKCKCGVKLVQGNTIIEHSTPLVGEDNFPTIDAAREALFAEALSALRTQPQQGADG